MRDCAFLVADKNMGELFRGFFGRQNAYARLGCGPFLFEAERDLRVAAGQNDPGLYVRGHNLLRPFQRTHRHAVIVLDSAWEGSPGTVAIEAHIRENLRNSGWPKDSADVIVIEPELENWVWLDSSHVARLLGFKEFGELRGWLDRDGLWPTEAAKPPDPKTAFQRILTHAGKHRSAAYYRKIIERASVRSCVDPAFQKLRSALQRWFPPADN